MINSPKIRGAGLASYIPRKICLKCHSFPCRSVATNSCHGGCWVISWTKHENYRVKDNWRQSWTSVSNDFQNEKKLLTSGGKQSSACLRRTEKPPWVLVSEAVSVLQNEWTVHLGDSGKGSSGLVTSLC